MPITLSDFLNFPFNSGRGVRANQVDGFTGLLYSFDLAYDSNTNRFEGTFTPAVESVSIGSLVAFETPATIPNNNMAAVCVLPVGGVDTEFAISDEGFNPILNNSLAPNTLYWARIYSGLSFVILSSNPSRSITRRVNRSISNADLKDLDTAYIDLVPTPGAGKYIEVSQFWLKRTGADRLPSNTPIYRLAISPNTVITEAEALAGNSTPFSSRALDIPGFSTAHYLFFGVNVLTQDIVGFDNIDFSAWEAVPGTIEVDGVTMKWLRTTASYANLAAIGATTLQGSIDRSRAYANAVANGAYLAMVFNPRALGTFPLATDEYVGVAFHGLDGFLRESGATPVNAEAVGGHQLQENNALLFGVIIGQPRERLDSSYSALGWAEYLNGIDDIAIEINIQYQVHNIDT